MYIDEVNKGLELLLPKNTYPKQLYDAMLYSVFSGGKRLRPTLFLASYDMLSTNFYDHEFALPFACAIEFIHAYSLIHDDLPSMDNDDFRRGKPSCHKAFGEAMAILAGDALLTLAFETLCDQTIKCNDLNVISAIKLICNAAGASGMVGGQAVDISVDANNIDEDTLLYIHEKKTVKLIATSLLSGAVLAGASDEKIDILAKAGEALGFSFQIMDDLLDFETEDNIENRGNYVSLFGKKKACEKINNLSMKAISYFKQLSGDSNCFLIKLTRDLMLRKN